MCGILAIYQQRPRWSEDQLTGALHTLQTRGPDGWGSWTENGLFLGHRRLAIIDLNSGAQPMHSHDGRYVITFNGEIYNYRELRSELEAKGQQFNTASDTEVILEAYRQWGTACVQHLIGMYAFAIWDRQEQALFAARDRLGIKPLCWTCDADTLILASTLAPIYALPGMDLPLDYEAVRDVLVYDYVPSPRTMIRNVHKLPPGHSLRWRPGDAAPQVQAHWTIPGPRQDVPPQEEVVSQLELLFDNAVERQMISDVPLGAFLSGGVDSSLIVAFMARHSAKPVKTFSVKFRQGSDESPIARQVADIFATDHTVLEAEEITGDDLLAMLSHFDEPISDPAIIPTVALSRLTRQHVTVALSGDGGDEVFGGYPKYSLGEERQRNAWYPWSRPAKWAIDHFPGRPRGAFHIYWRTLTPRERIQFAWTRYGPHPIFRKDMRLVLAADTVPKVNLDAFFDNWHSIACRWGEKYTSDAIMRTDLITYLSENCLFKTDRASMMESLEVRVPMLDEPILDMVIPLPIEAKINNGHLKALLRPLAQKLLPQAVWDRPKHGFTVPLDRAMSTQWASTVADLLAWGRTHAPLFNYDYLDRLVHINHREHGVGRELWSPLVILAWLRARQGEIRL